MFLRCLHCPILGRTASAVIVQPKSGGNGRTYQLVVNGLVLCEPFAERDAKVVKKSHICNIKCKKKFFFQKSLVVSKKSSTFAPRMVIDGMMFRLNRL